MANEPLASRDPLARTRVYQLAVGLIDEAWSDAEILKAHRVTEKVAPQLYSAVGSIGANVAEGYSRSSGRDRAKIFEYALGSARESLTWYCAARPVLGGRVVDKRSSVLVEIIKILLAVIPRERDRLIRPSSKPGAG
jgi:four helix bundle protein